MKKLYILCILFFGLILCGTSFAQSGFNPDSYKLFLSQNKNMTSSQLLQFHPAGAFKRNISSPVQNALYYDSVQIKYGLTEYEKQLIAKNGFMVTERNSDSTFLSTFAKVFFNDLPVFISADAILHAFHTSYDAVLKSIECQIIAPKIKIFLKDLHNQTGFLDSKYKSVNGMKNSLKDFDVYLTVALRLLGESEPGFYTENETVINELIDLVNKEKPVQHNIFGESFRKIDFSQFKPRGHYTDTYFPILAKYFRTMMWLGRIEFYIMPPVSYEQTKPADVRRQSADSYLMLEAAEAANVFPLMNELESIIGFFVGEQDNVTLPDMKELKAKTGIQSADKLLDSLTHKMLCDTLKKQPYAYQKILSQILSHDPSRPDNIVAASAFMPFGQRFVIDSYITGNTVYDRVDLPGIPKRMLPSLLDVLYALGNNPAGVLLKPELDKFGFSSNLASLRYLLDSYGDETWYATIYNMWLNSLKKLNPPENKTALPEFMQTAAYWQQKMNTQLSSWTELRHDNLLYAKQSYSGGATCSYPYSYVEPIPEFYRSIKKMSETISKKFALYDFETPYIKDGVINFFLNFAGIADTLANIADKELNGTAFSAKEELFLKQMISIEQVCGNPYKGWYTKLYYGSDKLTAQDFLVADMHTSPTDESGNNVGWVKHCGTGAVNLGVWIAELPGNKKIAFTGPVMSYYEYTTTNFLRLTDQEWLNTYIKKAYRPDFVNLYLANDAGETRGQGPDLTSVIEIKKTNTVPSGYITASNYPNPFNPSTIISFTIPFDLSNRRTELKIFNIQGELVKILVDEALPSGSYLTRWDGKNEAGVSVSSGIYLYNIKSGTQSFSGKMSLVK